MSTVSFNANIEDTLQYSIDFLTNENGSAPSLDSLVKFMWYELLRNNSAAGEVAEYTSDDFAEYKNIVSRYYDEPAKQEPTAEAIQAFAKQHGYNYPLFIDTFQFSSEEELDRNCIYLDKVCGQISDEERLDYEINEEDYYA